MPEIGHVARTEWWPRVPASRSVRLGGAPILSDSGERDRFRIRAADEMMDSGRGNIALGAKWRADAIAQLRMTMSVAEIAARLGLSRAAIYAALDEAPTPEQFSAQDVLDRGVEIALRDYLAAVKDADLWIRPFFESRLVLTDERKKRLPK